jgi:hypothetical protein
MRAAQRGSMESIYYLTERVVKREAVPVEQ